MVVWGSRQVYIKFTFFPRFPGVGFLTDSINIGEDDGDDVDEGRDGDDGMEEEMEPLGRA